MSDFASEVSFWVPELLVPSGWLEHAPFAFWLMDAHRPQTLVELGAHRGYSYFAFAQAVKRLGLRTHCVAVDTWGGDEHAGYYGEEIFQEVSARNSKQYWDFSELFRGTFDEAVPSFADGSIDLLHIDGRHFYADVRHDFETWRTKLSSRAIVLFHDTNVQVQGFGVHRLWSELKNQYPYFEFQHGHGLGVLGVGTDLPAVLTALFDTSGEPAAQEDIRRIYSRLGAALTDRAETASIREELVRQVSDAGAQLNRLTTELKATAVEKERVWIEKQSIKEELSLAVSKCERLAHNSSQLEAERDRLTSRSLQLEAERDRLTSRSLQLEAERDRLASKLSVSEDEAQRLRSEVLNRQQEEQRLRSNILDRKAEHEHVLADREKLKSELISQTAQLNGILRSTSWRLTSPIRWLTENAPSVKSALGPPARFLWWTVTFQLTRRLSLLRHSKSVAESGLFDKAFYLEHNRDVRDAGIDPLHHYMVRGASEGRNPHPLFDTGWYLRQYPDVAAAQVNPLAHYVRRGWKEGRKPNPNFDTSAYLAQHPELKEDGSNPLLHDTRASSVQARSRPGQDVNPLPVLPEISGKEDWEDCGRRRLNELLTSSQNLTFSSSPSPELSVILVFYNKAHLSLLCLDSLQANADCDYELIIIDNNSSDQTSVLLNRCKGATVIRNARNVGFGEACGMGAEKASGRYLLFLNNDTLLQPGTLASALDNFKYPEVGAVGGKILLANGDLQEAGSIIWSDGSAYGYGREHQPDLAQFEFRRQVDYCSAAFLFTPRELFHRLGGFDPRYAPAYYEDADYCMKIWEAGLRVIYDPECVIRHFESASSGGNDLARPLMAANQDKFVARWKTSLCAHFPPSMDNVIKARLASQSAGMRILYFDDRVPHRSLGSGLPRSNEILHQLAALGHHVTCVTVGFPVEAAATEYTDISRKIELVDGTRHTSKVFRDYVPNADLIWISRPHNLAAFLEQIVESGNLSAKLVFDAEAVFCDRDRLSLTLRNGNVPAKIWDVRLKRELALARAADAVIAVSRADQAVMEEQGIANVHVLGHSLLPTPTTSSFADRRTFLFVGALHGPENPNADSMRYFCTEIWPEIRQRTGAELVIAGFGTDRYLAEVVRDGIRIEGPVGNLGRIYNEARVFVAPTRYAAGIPFKIHAAAASGIPVVASALLGKQLGWENGVDLLVGQDSSTFADLCCKLYSDEDLWHKLRANALSRIAAELSPTAFADKISDVLLSVAVEKLETARA